ncbi:Periplasmic beta-glucosidase precursor [compost metagenome]
MDRIRLRSSVSGKYVRIASGEGAEAFLAATSENAADAAVFERGDWGWGSSTLRLVDTGKFVTETDSGLLTATANEASGWFVKEVFDFSPASDGQIEMKAWNGRPIVLNERGGLIAVGENVFDNAIKVDSRLPGEKWVVEIVENGIEKAVHAAKSAETAIVVVGNNPFINAKETIDRADIVLPPAQQVLIQAVRATNPNTVVVIVGSYPFAVNWENEHVPSILFTSHAAQELGHAVTDVLFGDYNPAGRLNMTWYQSVNQLPELKDYDIMKGKRTYQYFDGEVLYPFGHGLSYTTFEYSGLTLDRTTVGQDGEVQIAFEVRNSGDVAGDEVPQLYVRIGQSRVPRPLKALKGFTRLHLQPGEAKRVTFTLKADELAFWDVTRDRYCVEAGEVTVMVGSSSEVIALMATLQVEGETVPPRSLLEPVRAVNYDDYEQVFLDECREGGESIRLKSERGWIAFRDVDFGEGASRFEARVSGNLKGGEIAVTLDSTDGEAVVNCKLLPTGGRQAWTTVTAEAATGLSGRHDVYLHLQGEVQISWFKLC